MLTALYTLSLSLSYTRPAAIVPMANTKVVTEIPEEFDPFIWKCDSCGKEKKYTQNEIDRTHKPYPDPQNHDRDYYVTCPFCNTGIMEPPELVFFGGLFEELPED